MPVKGWGRAALPLAPGQHQVHVHTPYFFPRRADYPVDVPPGQFVELEYRAPLFSFSRVALGPPPQRYPGVGAVIAFISICLLIIVILQIAT
ncbi:MAG: hypothetical protein QOI39_1054 [Mycobacterium sp.]|nr:hypothetical protein [Mycobacterium sp.]